MRPGTAPFRHSMLGLILLGMAFAAACSTAAAGTAPVEAPAANTPTEEGCSTPEAAGIETCAPEVQSAPAPGVHAPALASLAAPAVPATPSATGPAPVGPTAVPLSDCTAPVCIFDTLVLQRPIRSPGQDTVDPTYRFGSTQEKARDPHHGVEFLNGYGTPVLAAMEGRVAVAGDDRITFYGPYSYFYGNLVVIEHTIPGLEEPLYSLYGHLSEIAVQVGQVVAAGQEIGKVGMTGVATGSHLHFEVRVGTNEYRASSNPEIWLAPRLDPAGVPMGALAGRVVDAGGNPLKVENLVLERLSEPGSGDVMEYYMNAYEEKALLGRPPFGESFGIGDLPAGRYRIHYAQWGLQTQEVEIQPGRLTVVTLTPRQTP